MKTFFENLAKASIGAGIAAGVTFFSGLQIASAADAGIFAGLAFFTYLAGALDITPTIPTRRSIDPPAE